MTTLPRRLLLSLSLVPILSAFFISNAFANDNRNRLIGEYELDEARNPPTCCIDAKNSIEAEKEFRIKAAGAVCGLIPIIVGGLPCVPAVGTLVLESVGIASCVGMTGCLCYHWHANANEQRERYWSAHLLAGALKYINSLEANASDPTSRNAFDAVFRYIRKEARRTGIAINQIKRGEFLQWLVEWSERAPGVISLNKISNIYLSQDKFVKSAPPQPQADDKNPYALDCESVQEDECAICLDALAPEHRVNGPNCVHGFHEACIQGWKNTVQNATCPLCRSSLAPAQQPAASEASDPAQAPAISKECPVDHLWTKVAE